MLTPNLRHLTMQAPYIFQKTSSSQSNAAQSTLGQVPDADLLEWADAQPRTGAFGINPAVTTEGVPAVGRYHGFLEIKQSGRRLTLTESSGQYRTWTNCTSSNQWTGWLPLATAMKPQEFDLPLADDYVAGASGAFYSKTQDGIVTITISDVQRADGLGLASGIMATIPVGFRPNRLISVACNFTAAEYNTKITSGILQALPNGEVWINTTDQSAHAIHGQICYIAGN